MGHAADADSLRDPPMGARSGRQYLDSLREGGQMWTDGARVADVTKDRRFAAAARTMADLYDMQHDPVLQDEVDLRVTHERRARGAVVCPAQIGRRSRAAPRHGESLDGRHL